VADISHEYSAYQLCRVIRLLAKTASAACAGGMAAAWLARQRKPAGAANESLKQTQLEEAINAITT